MAFSLLISHNSARAMRGLAWICSYEACRPALNRTGFVFHTFIIPIFRHLLSLRHPHVSSGSVIQLSTFHYLFKSHIARKDNRDISKAAMRVKVMKTLGSLCFCIEQAIDWLLPERSSPEGARISIGIDPSIRKTAISWRPGISRVPRCSEAVRS